MTREEIEDYAERMTAKVMGSFGLLLFAFWCCIDFSSCTPDHVKLNDAPASHTITLPNCMKLEQLIWVNGAGLNPVYRQMKANETAETHILQWVENRQTTDIIESCVIPVKPEVPKCVP